MQMAMWEVAFWPVFNSSFKWNKWTYLSNDFSKKKAGFFVQIVLLKSFAFYVSYPLVHYFRCYFTVHSSCKAFSFKSESSFFSLEPFV